MEDIKYNTFYGKIKSMMTSDAMLNMNVTIGDGSDINVKAPLDMNNLKIGYIYKLRVGRNSNSEKNAFYLFEATKVANLTDPSEINMAYRLFDNSCPYKMEELEEIVYQYVDKIENKIIKDLTLDILNSSKDKFFIYPAAQRFHHNYVGGLAYHTAGMLKMADSFLSNYPYLNKDYLYSGVILHDVGKIEEFSGVDNTEYTLKGQLLGHLVMGGQYLMDSAKKLGYENTEEALILDHMIISHHGQQMFGACKRPQTAEAAALWYIDTLDSKFRVLGEELANTDNGSFTDVVGVMDKTKFYKTK